MIQSMSHSIISLFSKVSIENYYIVSDLQLKVLNLMESKINKEDLASFHKTYNEGLELKGSRESVNIYIKVWRCIKNDYREARFTNYRRTGACGDTNIKLG
jgi:hypothetical protein